MFQQPDRQQLSLQSSDQQIAAETERENIKFHNKAIYFRTNTLPIWVGSLSIKDFMGIEFCYG